MSGWGFKIDYVKAIADDDQRIAWAELSIRNGWYQRPVGTHIAVALWELILYFPDVSTTAGLTLQDVADYARAVDAEFAWTHNPALPEARQDGAGYRRGMEVDAEIAKISASWRLFRDEAEARVELRRAKASRARHIRNQEQYGRPAVRP